jgi:hypothetical protein
MADSNDKYIILNNFNAGFSPLAFKDRLTEVGGGGHASYMKNCDVIDGRITQGPGLANLTNGTHAGVVDQLISFIMDKAVASDQSYAIGTSKLFQISSTAVANTGIWPHAVTGMTSGQSIFNLQGNLYYLYNKASGGDIGKYDLDSTFTDNWGSLADAALESASHPVDTKEDIAVFGNGQYVGTYLANSDTLTVQKLDFGAGSVVSDVIFANNYWYLVVNSGVSGRMKGQVYLWNAGALETVLDDETGVGIQEIGFLMMINGIVWLAYRDETEGGFIIGYISGRQVVPMSRYTGTLPNFQQKTLYKGTILTLSDGLAYSAGAIVPELPFQLSQVAPGGYDTVGAVAAPFGTPMVASTQNTSYRLAKFSGYSVDSSWESIVFSLMGGGYIKGFIDSITVLTKSLGANARADLTIEADQAISTSSTHQITGEGKTRHIFTSVGLGNIEDFKVKLDWSNGSATDDCLIRKIIIKLHYTEN